MFPGVRLRTSTAPGRGRALREAWLASDATVLVYMDVDLSTDLAALLPLVAPLISGHSDLAIGTRLAGSSRVVRGAKREFISRSYNLLLRGALATHVSDAQCGFKAIRADVAAPAAAAGRGHRLVLRHRAAGARRARRAADRTRCPSTGSTTPTAGWTSSPPRGPTWPASCGCCGPSPPARLPIADLRAQIGRRPLVEPACPECPPGWSASWSGSPRSACSPRWPTSCSSWCCAPVSTAQAANLVALLLTAVANTAANRRFTFGVRGRGRRGPGPGAGPDRLRPRPGADQRQRWPCCTPPTRPGTALEVVVLVAANLAATVLRFVLLPALGVPRPAHRTRPRRPSRNWSPPDDHRPDDRADRREGADSSDAADRPVPAPCVARPGDTRWVRPALLTLLAVTGVLYLWDLSASGWANAFYAAAVQAGSRELEGVLLRLVRRRATPSPWTSRRRRCG